MQDGPLLVVSRGQHSYLVLTLFITGRGPSCTTLQPHHFGTHEGHTTHPVDWKSFGQVYDRLLHGGLVFDKDSRKR